MPDRIANLIENINHSDTWESSERDEWREYVEWTFLLQSFLLRFVRVQLAKHWPFRCERWTEPPTHTLQFYRCVKIINIDWSWRWRWRWSVSMVVAVDGHCFSFYYIVMNWMVGTVGEQYLQRNLSKYNFIHSREREHFDWILFAMHSALTHSNSSSSSRVSHFLLVSATVVAPEAIHVVAWSWGTLNK